MGGVICRGHPRRLMPPGACRILPRLHPFGPSGLRCWFATLDLTVTRTCSRAAEDRAALVRRHDAHGGRGCSTSVAGLTAGIDLASRPDGVGKRGFEAMERGFHDEGIMFRIVGDSIAVTPPLIVSESQIGEIFEKVGKVIKALA
jgi:adenosylmethionine-8-amino-7-oxononanoate aminotransferase